MVRNRGFGKALNAMTAMACSRDTVDFSRKNLFPVYKTLNSEGVFTSYSREEGLIDLCHKDGYFFSSERMSGCNHLFAVFKNVLCTNLLRRYSRHLEGFGRDRGWYSKEATNHDSNGS